MINTQRKTTFSGPKADVIENIYHELFLRYAECSLDEEISNFKNLKENF
jgi:hypothetical protein